MAGRMNILYLGPRREAVWQALVATGDQVVQCEDKLAGNGSLLASAEWLVSYGYRHIIREDVIRRFPNRIVNLHISYLPYNRGAEPNLWSFLEDTPKGVSIHLIDIGIDTGPILAQQLVSMGPHETLRTSYDKLSEAIETLFRKCWPKIRAGQCAAIPQTGSSTFHRIKDSEPYRGLLTSGWDTPVSACVGRGLSVAERGAHAE